MGHIITIIPIGIYLDLIWLKVRVLNCVSPAEAKVDGANFTSLIVNLLPFLCGDASRWIHQSARFTRYVRAMPRQRASTNAIMIMD